jgi:hypothetical protein
VHFGKTKNTNKLQSTRLFWETILPKTGAEFAVVPGECTSVKQGTATGCRAPNYFVVVVPEKCTSVKQRTQTGFKTPDDVWKKTKLESVGGRN